MLFGLYRALTTLGGPLIERHLRRRLARGKEDRDRFPERMGVAGRPRPEGALAWLHAASVGEALSILVVVDRLLAERPDLSVLVTTGTVTSARIMTDRLGGRAFHQYHTVDRLPWVRRFLDHWRPDLVLWTESEFWPNSLAEIGDRGIPLILLNGRVSDRSFRRWKLWPGLIRRVLGAFTLCLGQTGEDRDRLARMGAARAECVG
ncbi:MAG: 3-deoxy-D-manno-octulosonic acid transferase, partial [Alphaproteobacteria bacterium]|nr:3-deoxy-D-manno-octulosonic acid transferase [Alphaproteobacteria bacterium]